MESGQRKSPLIAISYIYAALPIMIFIIGWTKSMVAVPALLLVIIGLWKMIKNALTIHIPVDRMSYFKVTWVALLMIVIWVLLSGIGGYSYQNFDHMYRNAIFDMIVVQNWPITHEIPTATLPNPVVFTYYIGFWLPPALFGKLFGIQIGYLAQYIWAIMGIYLIYRLTISYLKTDAIWPLILFIFFSGLDIVGTIILGHISEISFFNHLEWWCSPFQFSSFSTDLFWVFNQSIPIWLITILILHQRNNKYMILLISLSMITSTLPFIGLIPIAIILMFNNLFNNLQKEKFRNYKEKLRYAVSDIVSFENTIVAAIVSSISWMYLRGNNAAQYLSTTNREFTTIGNFMLTTLIFLLFEVVPYAILLFKYNKKNLQYWTVLITLTLSTMVKIGHYGDFTMRASLPALFLFYILTSETLLKAYVKKDRITIILLVGVIVVGAATPLVEINRTLYETYSRWKSDKEITAGTIDLTTTPADNFWGDKEGNLFFRYFAK